MAIDFRVRDFFHPGSILRLHRQFARNQWKPAEEIESDQLDRLRRILSRAGREIPYYRRLFAEIDFEPARLGSISELGMIPLLDRETIRARGPEMRAPRPERLGALPQRTSGTSGSPIEFLADRHSQTLEFVYYWRHWSWAGYRLGDRFAELGSQHFLRRSDDGLLEWQPQLRRLMLNSARVSAAAARELAGAIRRHRPKFLKGMPSAVFFLGRAFEEAGIADIRFRAVFTNGEVVTPQQRKAAESVFGCPVLDSYGHMERTAAISQCMHGSYHVVQDYGLLEFLDPRPEGDGVIARAVGTSLHNRAMPLLRYDIGDEIELFRDSAPPCPCGRGFPVVKRILGRSRDVIVTPDGRHLTSLFVLPEMVRGVLLSQLVQETRANLCIRVVPDREWSPLERDRLLLYATRMVGPGMKVRIEVAEKEEVLDPSGKIRPVSALGSDTERCYP
jgi:phenylacetate-CoA ligase